MGICFVFRNDAFWILAVPPNLTVPPLPPVDTDFRVPDAAFFAVSLPPLESLRAIWTFFSRSRWLRLMIARDFAAFPFSLALSEDYAFFSNFLMAPLTALVADSRITISVV